MKFEDDNLRICPKCKSSVDFSGEEKAKCPECGAVVWFFNYQPLGAPPECRQLKPLPLWHSAFTKALLVVVVLSAITTVVGVRSISVVTVLSGMTVVSLCVLAGFRHFEAVRAETALEHYEELQVFSKAMGSRISELTARYDALLRTGDARIEYYYREIYAKAEQERLAALVDREAVRTVEDRIYSIAERFINDHQAWSVQKLRPDDESYQRRKLELEKAFQTVEAVGYKVPNPLKKDALQRLKLAYAEVVKAAAAKDAQKRIQLRIREEARLKKEADEAVRQAEEQEKLIEQRLKDAMKEHREEMSVEVESLRRQLAEVRERAERAKSMAQLTKSGYVYVLSNIGSFGERVFKVGMTRRLEPQERVDELSDASVPFPFDVHAMISCENAPALENALHHELTPYRVNRINLRKEFFRVDLEVIMNCVRAHHGKVEYIAEPEAVQFRESQLVNAEQLIEAEAEYEALESDLSAAGIELDDDE